MKRLLRVAVVAAASVCAAAYAQDDEGADGNETASEEQSGEEESGGEDAPEAKNAKVAVSPSGSKLFSLLPYCRRVEGRVEVLKPTSTKWETAVEDKFYPLGTCYRTFSEGDAVKVQFGKDAFVEVKNGASFGTMARTLGEQTRAITLLGGEVSVSLPRNFPDGAFSVTSRGFTATNLSGESLFVYGKMPDGDSTTIRCVTGGLDVEGLHFRANRLKAANEIKLRSANESLFTAIYGISGDVDLMLDQGTVMEKDYETGESKKIDKKLEWKLSPLTAVRIHRALPDIGERMAVTVMTFNASGNLVNRCAFTEGLYEVNSGELCITKKSGSDDLSNRASEAAETEESEVAEEEEGEEDDSSGENADSSGEDGDSAQGNASGSADGDLDF